MKGMKVARQGDMMRPGAFMSPAWVWHELQAPTVCGLAIARVAAPLVIFTVNGEDTAVFE